MSDEPAEEIENVTPLREVPTIAPFVKEALVEAFERCLALAKEGKIRAAAMVLYDIDGETVSRYDFDNGHSIFLLLGGMEWLKHRMVTRLETGLDEEEEETE